MFLDCFKRGLEKAWFTNFLEVFFLEKVAE